MQMQRMFEIVYILLNKKTCTAKEFAERFEVSIRTIYRDVESLSSAGIPIYMSKGKGGGISLLPNYILNKSILTEEEKNEILYSLQAMSAVSLTNNKQMVGKLSQFFSNQSHKEWIEINFHSWNNELDLNALFEQLKQAILNNNIIEFEYYSAKEERTNRRIEPVKLYYRGKDWYIYGYCTIKKEFRFFKLQRMQNCHILNEKFIEREVPVLLDDKPNIPTISLTLKINKSMSYRILDECSHFEILENGDYLVHLVFPNQPYLYQYILSFGENCEVISPSEVKDKVKEIVNKLYNFYL